MYYLSIVFWVATVFARENCDTRGVLVYEDLGCIPEKLKSNDTCPEKYNCIGLEPSTGNCFFRGKVYSNGENVYNKLTTPSCRVLCSCNGESGKFYCGTIDCELRTTIVYPPRNCYSKYSLDYCQQCSIGKTCEPFDNITTCEIDGKTYKEGQLFEPKDTCLTCLCQKGFTGKLEAPFCRKQICDIQLRNEVEFVQRKCAPIYSSKSPHCCPYYWACADGTEEILGEAKSDNLVCYFGDKLVKKGQTFVKTNITSVFGITFETVKCECDVPPLVKCLLFNNSFLF